MAAEFTPNLHEQASIWCLFSMAQVHPPTLHLSRLRTHLNSSSSRSPFFVADVCHVFRDIQFLQQGEGRPQAKDQKVTDIFSCLREAKELGNTQGNSSPD
jgi:hypothetical protein